LDFFMKASTENPLLAGFYAKSPRRESLHHVYGEVGEVGGAGIRRAGTPAAPLDIYL
jgi:hypothetical protein